MASTPGAMVPDAWFVPVLPSQCCAVIPARDEAGRVGAVVRSVLRHVPVAWVVDDGSTDATGAEARSAGARVLRHDRPRGKGASLRTGWAAAMHAGVEWMVLLDGDGQHDPADIPALVTAAGEASRLVVGNRMASPGPMPWSRRLANRWLSARVSATAHQSIPDSQCGFRVAHLPALASLAIRSEGFEIESELCLAFSRAGFAVVSVPVRCIYGGQPSRISPWRDGLRWWRWYRSARRPLPP